ARPLGPQLCELLLLLLLTCGAPVAGVLPESSVQCDALSLAGNLSQKTAVENSAPLTVLPLSQNHLNLWLLLLLSRLWWPWHLSLCPYPCLCLCLCLW